MENKENNSENLNYNERENLENNSEQKIKEAQNELKKANKGDRKITYVLIALAAIAVIIVVIIFNSIKGDSSGADSVDTEPEEIQVGLTDIKASDSEIQELSELNNVLDSYVSEHYDDKKFVSSYGMLFSIETNTNITVQDIVKEGLITLSDNVGNSNYVDIIYIKGSDLGLSNNDFKVCSVYNTSDGYYISAKGLEGKYYTEQEYHDLILKYSFVHGTVTNPKAGDANYNAIKQAASITDDYDIKHLACDDKYAVIVANNLKDTADFKETVLVKEDGKWTVGIGNLVSAKCAKQAANKSYPDMELGLMPIYNIGDYQGILSDLTQIEQKLVDAGELTESDIETAYSCSAGEFAYIQTTGGKRLLGCMYDGKLDFNEYSSLEETISAMTNLRDDPPVFILKFN